MTAATTELPVSLVTPDVFDVIERNAGDVERLSEGHYLITVETQENRKPVYDAKNLTKKTFFTLKDGTQLEHCSFRDCKGESVAAVRVLPLEERVSNEDLDQIATCALLIVGVEQEFFKQSRGAESRPLRVIPILAVWRPMRHTF